MQRSASPAMLFAALIFSIGSAMKKSLLLTALHLGKNSLGGNFGTDSTGRKLRSSKVFEQITEAAPLQLGKSLQRVKDNAGKRHMHPLFCAHGADGGRVVAPNQEKKRKNVALVSNLVDVGPQIGHVSSMPKETSSDPYKSKRHKFYAEPWIASGLDELARINKSEKRKGQTRSQIIEIAAMKLLRANAARLRKAGVKLPEELFAK